MFAKRIDNLPPYLFARIDEMKAKKRGEGVDVILTLGDYRGGVKVKLYRKSTLSYSP